PRLLPETPFADPGLLVSFALAQRAFLFDLGSAIRIFPRDILKLSHVFVSHTHVDHFIGFDHLVRIVLGRDRKIHFFGPEGFLRNVEGKLAGYNWNLVAGYDNDFVLMATEVTEEALTTRSFLLKNAFAPDEESTAPFTGDLLSEPSLTVSARILDHKIPCLGFRLTERFHINVLKPRLLEMGLCVGPWLSRLKALLFEEADPGTPILAPCADGSEKSFPLGELAEQITVRSPGQVLAYVTDARPTEENRAKILELASGADQAFLEAAFLHRDADLAAERGHLTARQAGELARQAGAKTLSVFHLSPRYTDNPQEIYAEAERAFSGL
ncbi:MAG: ribonuclease Z, partial [Thermodesulfobacteriota bacterium]